MPHSPLEDENLPLFTVGQVAQMLEIQQAFLRRLDQLRVVSPSRSAGNQRRYTRREVTVVRYVTNLVDEGMTLSAIRRVLELEQQVSELEARVRELEAERDVLRDAVAERAALLAAVRPAAAERSPHPSR
jgi:MerR family transcriptional regulator, heat shock protein HspR